MTHTKKILVIQSVADIITNSSSEVFITDYMPALPSGESWANVIDRDFMLRYNHSDASYTVWYYLEDKYGLKNPIDDRQVDPSKPDELEFVWSYLLDKFKEKYGDRKTNRELMEIFDKYAEEHEELKSLMDGHHFVVSLSDHDDDYWDYPVEGELVYGH